MWQVDPFRAGFHAILSCLVSFFQPRYRFLTSYCLSIYWHGGIHVEKRMTLPDTVLRSGFPTTNSPAASLAAKASARLPRSGARIRSAHLNSTCSSERVYELYPVSSHLSGSMYPRTWRSNLLVGLLAPSFCYTFIWWRPVLLLLPIPPLPLLLHPSSQNLRDHPRGSTSISFWDHSHPYCHSHWYFAHLLFELDSKRPRQDMSLKITYLVTTLL
jgi:hypothetical protein